MSCRPDIACAHPIEISEANRRVEALIGVARPITLLRWRAGWWDRLRGAVTTEERLTCQRMIDALGRGIGLAQHEQGEALAARNLGAAQAAAREDAEAAAVALWA